MNVPVRAECGLQSIPRSFQIISSPFSSTQVSIRVVIVSEMRRAFETFAVISLSFSLVCANHWIHVTSVHLPT
jgi:hypothetical protein